MKREFLENFKVGDQSLPKEIVDAIMAENGNDIENAKKPFSDYETVKQQLADANETIEGFKAMDIDSVKKAADDWKTKAEKAEKDAAAKIAEMKFDSLLNSVITRAKGKNAKAITALMNVETLRNSNNQEADIQAALEEIKKENGYLFDDSTPPPYASGTGGKKMLNNSSQDFSLPDALRERYATKG